MLVELAPILTELKLTPAVATFNTRLLPEFSSSIAWRL